MSNVCHVLCLSGSDFLLTTIFVDAEDEFEVSFSAVIRFMHRGYISESEQRRGNTRREAWFEKAEEQM